MIFCLFLCFCLLRYLKEILFSKKIPKGEYDFLAKNGTNYNEFGAKINKKWRLDEDLFLSLPIAISIFFVHSLTHSVSSRNTQRKTIRLETCDLTLVQKNTTVSIKANYNNTDPNELNSQKLTENPNQNSRTTYRFMIWREVNGFIQLCNLWWNRIYICKKTDSDKTIATFIMRLLFKNQMPEFSGFFFMTGGYYFEYWCSDSDLNEMFGHFQQMRNREKKFSKEAHWIRFRWKKNIRKVSITIETAYRPKRLAAVSMQLHLLHNRKLTLNRVSSLKITTDSYLCFEIKWYTLLLCSVMKYI